MKWSLLPILFGLMIGGCNAPASPDSGPPNIVLLFADDMGYGDLSSYGHPTIHTPHLDALAREGLKLTSFYSAAPVCTPARAALLTGRYPIRSGLTGVFFPEDTTGIPAYEWTLAEALQEAGYKTGAFGKWHLGSSEGFFPTDHGFDTYFGFLYSNDMIRPWVQTDVPLQLWRDKTPIEHPVDQAYLTERYTEEALTFIREHQDDPFFVYLPYAMPHVPIYASPTFSGQSAGGLYGDVIETIDWSAGQLVAVLEELELRENTLIIFTSDNGANVLNPRFLQMDLIKRWDIGSNGPLRGHKRLTLEGGMRVPGIINWPASIEAGQVNATPVSTLDLYTTLIHAAGGAMPDDERPVDGRNLIPWLTEHEPLEEHPFYYHARDRLEAIRVGDWKLRHCAANLVACTGEMELYHLGRDPYEQFNVAAEHPDIVRRLGRQMQIFAAETGAQLSFSSLP